MKNVYDGVVELDSQGEAVVVLPNYFEALNSDFRYQLTSIGRHAPIFIADEVGGNQFRIAGGRPGMRVSWQVTGIRKDAWANAHRIVPEVEKEPEMQGRYLHPVELGKSISKGSNVMPQSRVVQETQQ
jgi:trimeric autotransporter adhesin